MKQNTWKIIDLINWGSEYFGNKGIDSPRLNMELMLCDVLGFSRMEIYLNFEKPLLQKELDRLREMVIRRAKREPLQYILGYTEFYGKKIFVNENVIVPRPETEILIDSVIKNVAKEDVKNVLDLGTGSGCITVALAEHFPDARFLAIDNNEKALSLAARNLEYHNFGNVELKHCDILQEVPDDGKFDLILSNPPYIPYENYVNLQPEVSKYEPQKALTDGNKGLTFYRRFAEIFPELMQEGGQFFLEIDNGQADELDTIFEQYSYKVNIYRDLSGLDRVLHGLR